MDDSPSPDESEPGIGRLNRRPYKHRGAVRRSSSQPGDATAARLALRDLHRNHALQHKHKTDGDPKAQNHVADVAAVSPPPPAPPPPVKSEETREGDSSLDASPGPKPPLPQRFKAGCKRFAIHTKDALFHSWINVLLIFVPIGIAMNFVNLPGIVKPTIVFSLNAVAIIPLAGLLAFATESVASRMGDTWASLLNVTFGNAVELIIFIIALAKDQIGITQASILGSILANLLLILGMSFLFGGLRFQEQIYNNTVTQMSTVLLSLSVMSLLLPTAFHASFVSSEQADKATTKISRGVSVVLLIVYVLYLLFQLKSHAYLYESTPQEKIDEESHPGVLADILNSSSSDDDSSSSDSGSSVGSHVTATKRIKRAFKKRMRRRSGGAESMSNGTAASTLTSPTSASISVHEKQDTSAIHESPESSASPGFEYFDQTPDKHHEAGTLEDENEHPSELPSITARRNFETVTRDFGAENEKPEPKTKTSPRKFPRSLIRKPGKKRSAVETPKQDNLTVDQPHRQASSPAAVEQSSPRVFFSDEVHIDSGSGPESNEAMRRGFPRTVSRTAMRGPPHLPLPRLLSNTVFTQPPPARPSGGNVNQHSLSLAHRPGPSRTKSLPGRLLQEQAGVKRTDSGRSGNENAPPVQPLGGLPGNAAEAKMRDNESKGPDMSRTAAVVLLLVTTGLVAFCAELLVEAIPEMVANTSVSEAFIGLIVLPIVGNAAEHVTAVTVATKNKMDLAIGVAVGSSIQIALFVTPIVVLLGWILSKDMSLYFNLFETVSLFVTVFVINFLILDGRSNYLEGSLLIAAYVIIALSAFFYPQGDSVSQLGNSNTPVGAVSHLLAPGPG